MEELLTARATLIFLVANVALSVLAFSNDAFMRWGILNTRAVFREREYLRVLFSGFLHADPMHLLFNMVTLFFFGPSVESVLGSQAFFLIYLGALIGGNLFALWRHRHEPDYLALGASGAISGVVFTFCLFAPMAMIFVFFFPVPAVLYAILFVAYSMYGMRTARDNIGHDAHLGGAVIGILIALILYPELLQIFVGQVSQVFN